MKYLILIILAVVYVYFLIPNKPVQPKLEPIIFNEPIVESPKDTHIEDIINKVNEKNSVINGFSSKAIIQTNGMELNAEIYYRKDKMFRMFIYGPLGGLNLDIGSNSDIFWFWSKGFDRNTLYWASYEEGYSKTRLKTPFNPTWIMESLGYEKVVGDKYKEDEKYLKVFREDIISRGRKVVKAVMIDKKNLTIVGHYVYDLSGKLLVSSERNENSIDINWLEENQKMSIKLYNQSNKIGNFIPPVKRSKIDMNKM